MNITIHRGTHQIGGCITEICNENSQGQKTRVFIDIGSNLPGNKRGRKVDVKNITDGCDAIFITHYHGDHIGEYMNVPNKEDGKPTPIYMGEISQKIFLKVQETLADANEKIKKFVDVDAKEIKLSNKIGVTWDDVNRVKKFEEFKFKHGETKQIGSINVTPIRTDHSAFDSYMFFIEAKDKKGQTQSILHTGDFRMHGLSGADVLNNIVSVIGKKSIDVLICEGTMLSRQSADTLKESELRNIAECVFREKENIFILCSSTNIDSLKSFYDAAVKTDKLFVVDEYQYDLLKIASSIYEFNEKNIFVCKINSPGKNKKLFAEIKAISKGNGFCMPVRYSGTQKGKNKFVEIVKHFPDSLLIYSLWDGYLKKDTKDFDICKFIKEAKWNGKSFPGSEIPRESLDINNFLEVIKKVSDKKLACASLHTSGHATKTDIEKLVNKTKPKVIIPIHGDSSYNFEKINISGKLNIEHLDDGDTYDITQKKLNPCNTVVDIDNYIEQISMTAKAKSTIEEIDSEVYEKFSKWFHIRPRTDDFTIVTTHPYNKYKYAMRGIFVCKSKIKDAVEFISEQIPDVDGDEEAAKEMFEKIRKSCSSNKRFLGKDKSNKYIVNANGKGFEDGRTEKEFIHQAKMINGLSKNNALIQHIKNDYPDVNELCFIASEVVFARGDDKRLKIDIVAHDNIGKIFFFELKEPENIQDDPIRQVNRYLRLYNKTGAKNKVFEEMMAVYPQNSIKNIKEYIGYAVVGYSDCIDNKDSDDKMLIKFKADQ